MDEYIIDNKMNNILHRFKDSFVKDTYGMSIAEAHRKDICIQCREQALPKCYSNAGRREYRMSGLCEKCFDNILKK